MIILAFSKTKNEHTKENVDNNNINNNVSNIEYSI